MEQCLLIDLQPNELPCLQLLHQYQDQLAAVPTHVRISGRSQNPKKKLPITIFHGLQDLKLPYGEIAMRTQHGNREYFSTPDTAAFWANHNGCTPQPLRLKLYKGEVELSTWDDCSGNI